MVNHEELIKILPCFGIKKTSLNNWFRNYLTDRQQIVKINKTLGQKRKIICGVPQGSVLGPLFFILYINCICNTNIDGKIVIYADDTQVRSATHCSRRGMPLFLRLSFHHSAIFFRPGQNTPLSPLAAALMTRVYSL